MFGGRFMSPICKNGALNLFFMAKIFTQLTADMAHRLRPFFTGTVCTRPISSSTSVPLSYLHFPFFFYLFLFLLQNFHCRKCGVALGTIIVFSVATLILEEAFPM